ncbi:MAG: ATP-binding protein [Deltaproteobacteria bacterium]|nr:ATP-binding protein [Deltaproteobacteria bacterium]
MNELSLHGIGIADRDGVIRYTNKVCQNIYGLKSEEIIGRHFREFYADPKTLNSMLAQARTYGRVDNYPIMARHRDGLPIPVEVSLMRVQDSSRQLLGSVAVIHDKRNSEDLLSQMQKQEMALIRLNRSLEWANLELERTNRLKDEFLANTSHELRTPLSAVLGFLRIVLDKLYDNPAEEREFIQNAYDSAKNLLNLINELLDTAKIEAGKVDLNLVKVDVSLAFEEVKKLSQLQAAQKGLRLTFQAHQVKVRADPDKLHQVLLNLVANAIKFTQAGEVGIIARPYRAKGHVRFEINDTGIGIPQEIQRDLFQKFVQGDGSTSRKYGGSGLGLAICKNLVEFMGGRIWLSSPGPGQGATFYFTLPLISETPLYWRRLEDRERGLEVHGPGEGPLVLVVEDEPKVVEVMTRILNKHGYRTAYAVTADDGLEGARRLNPAVITIDMGLPARPEAFLRDGLDLCAALQKDPQTSGIPLILVTGHDTSIDHRMKEMPPTLTKPFRAQQLVQKLGELLAR